MVAATGAGTRKFFPRRAVLSYTGAFPAPIFETMGSPARLYGHLLRNLAGFGADVRSLSVDVSTLANAQVVCFLGVGTVRIRLQSVEVVLKENLDREILRQIVESTWKALSETAPGLAPVQHQAALDYWGTVEGVEYRDFIAQFVRPLTSFGLTGAQATWTNDADEGHPSGTVAIQEAVDVPGTLFLRLVARFSASETLETVGKQFALYVGHSGRALGLQMEGIVK